MHLLHTPSPLVAKVLRINSIYFFKILEPKRIFKNGLMKKGVNALRFRHLFMLTEFSPTAPVGQEEMHFRHSVQ